ncbi:MAG: hypothetical protein EBS41_07210 [Actinobacteria bacterium]|nr:hypothetical protein [Actinomycetota bacterium]
MGYLNDRAVVVTGMGATTPIGNNVTDFWANLRACAQESAVCGHLARPSPHTDCLSLSRLRLPLSRPRCSSAWKRASSTAQSNSR